MIVISTALRDITRASAFVDITPATLVGVGVGADKCRLEPAATGD